VNSGKLLRQQVDDDPMVGLARQRAEEALRAYTEAAQKVLATRLGRTDLEPVAAMPRLELRKKDPNPWSGKPAVPGILLRMLLDEPRWVTEYTTNTGRHAAMKEQACRTAAEKQGAPWQPSNTVSPSVWSRELKGYQLSNALRDLKQRGYKPAKTDSRLSDFVKLIRAGVPDAPGDAPREYLHYGAGIHEVRFYRANEMWYRNEFYNVQWSKQGKKCDPLNGNAKAIIYRDAKRQSKGIFVLLADSVTRDEWPTIRKIASDAEQRYAAGVAVRELKQKREQRAQQLEALGLFEAETPARSERPHETIVDEGASERA